MKSNCFELEVAFSPFSPDIFYRWVFVVLFLPALVFQFVIHADHGAVGLKKDGEYNSRLGLWRYCLDKDSEVTVGRGDTLRVFYSKSMCIRLDRSTPKEMLVEI